MADHSEVKAAVAALTDACPFLWVDQNHREKLDSSFSADEVGGAWEVLESDGRIGTARLRSWKDLTNEEKAQVIKAARARLAADHDSDNYQGVHMLMYAIGAYEGLARPSSIDNNWIPTVSDFAPYTSALDGLAADYRKFEVNDVELQNGWTQLMSKAGRGSAAEIQALIQAGHDVNAETRAKYVPVVENDGVNYRQDSAGTTLTPLSIAVRCGNSAGVDALIQGKADVNKKDSGGFSPLWYAVSSPYIPADAQLKMTQSLVNAKADLGFKAPDGTTLLIAASKNKNADLTLYLLQQDACKASINEVDSQNHNALFYAVQGCSSSKGAEVVRAMLGANAKIQQDTIDFVNNPASNVPAEVKQLILDTYVKQEKVPALLEAVQKGDVATMNKLLNEDLASLSIDSFPIAEDKTGSLLDYALDNSANKPAVIESLLARAGEDPTKPPQVTDEILAKAEQQASGGNADAVKVFNLIRDRYNAQHPVAENALEAALKANSGKGDMSAARRAIAADLNGNQLGTLNKPSMMQAYFYMSHEYYKEAKNAGLKKTFHDLAEYQRQADSATDPQKKAEASAKVQELLNGLKNDVAQYNALSPEERTAIDFIIENSKPKDKVQELRQAIASGNANEIIKALESADEETLKTVAKDPALMASCYKILGAHYKESSDENTKKLGAQYAELSKLFDKLAKETDATKKTEVEGKIAEALKNLSGQEMQGLMSAGEKQMITSLSSTYTAQGNTRGNDADHGNGNGNGNGNGIGGGGTGHVPGNTTTTTTTTTPTVLNPVQEGVALAQAKAEEEKTPWYKQEWLWWVLGIALAATLGYFSFRKGGWLNKDDDDKEPVVVDPNTNDNSNSNSNSNTGNESGGTLDNSAQNITSAELNDMIASGGRVSRQSSDRS